MDSYRISKYENNLFNYLKNKDIIEQIESIFYIDNIKTEILMDMINILADFVQYNKFLADKKSFNDLADFLVITIDLFNNDYELIDKITILDKLKELITCRKMK